MASIVTFQANSFQEGIALQALFVCGAMRGLALTLQYMSLKNNLASAQKECIAKEKTCLSPSHALVVITSQLSDQWNVKSALQDISVQVVHQSQFLARKVTFAKKLQIRRHPKMKRLVGSVRWTTSANLDKVPQRLAGTVLGNQRLVRLNVWHVTLDSSVPMAAKWASARRITIVTATQPCHTEATVTMAISARLDLRA